MKENNFEKINFIFQIGKKTSQIEELSFLYNKLDLLIKKISMRTINNEILIDGKIDNKNLVLEEDFIKRFYKKKVSFKFENLICTS